MTAPSQWLWIECSTKIRKRRQLQPAQWLNGRPKRDLSPFDPVLEGHRVITRCAGHGVEYHPNVTPNGHTGRSNPSWLSRRPDERREVSARCWTGEGDQAGCHDGGGYPKKQRLEGKPQDRLTWGCCTRGHRSRMSPSFMANAQAYRKPDASPTLSARVSSPVGE